MILSVAGVDLAPEPAKIDALIIGVDEQARLIASAVERCGRRAFVLDLDDVGEGALLSEEGGKIFAGSTRLDRARAVYVRHLPWSPLLPRADEIERVDVRDWRDRHTAAREKNAMALSILRTLDDGRRSFVNRIATLDLHSQKPWQLSLLRNSGVRVPRSIVTSSAERAAAFVRRVGEVVYKPVSGGAQARLFVDDDFVRLRLLANAPAIFQERVRAPGDREHRVYVLGGKVLASFAIPTDGVVDARERLRDAERVKAPQKIARAAVRAAKALGLALCAVDLRGEVVLEANPTPALLPFDVDGSMAMAVARFLCGTNAKSTAARR